MANAVDADNRNVAIRIFKKQFDEIEKKCSINSFVAQMKEGQTFSFNGFYKENRGRVQLIFNEAAIGSSR